MTDINHEQLLIEAIKQGNQKVFEYLFHYYYSGLVVYATKYVESREIAEDLVQDFFVNTWLKRDYLAINQSIKSYFFTSIRNRSLDYLRHQHVKTKSIKKIAEQTTDQAQPDHFIIESELRSVIENAIDKLPPMCREVFVLNRMQGLKPNEIAAQKKISVRTVEGHIGKALKLLKTDLNSQLPGWLIVFVLNVLSDSIS